jgi:antitoxin (DNA-binding transcriptional repressor) of toxin-antitoxin stability system
MTKEIAISQFKTHCLEIIDKLQVTHEPIIITKRDKPVATITAFEEPAKASIFGLLKDKAKIKGNIVKPIAEKWSCEK